MFDVARERVFIVEDNELMVRIYRSIFDSLGYASAFAARADEAIRMLGQRQPDLIIVDDVLPDGSGVDVTRTLRATPAFARTPIIAVGSNAAGTAQEAMEIAGCTEFIAKPIQIDAFAHVVQRYLSLTPVVSRRVVQFEVALAPPALIAA